MPIQVSCENPQCRKSLRVKDELAGKKVKCPGCGTTFTTVAPASVPVAVPVASVPVAEPFVLKKEDDKSCPGCGAKLAEAAVLCIQCGYNLRTGERLKTRRGQEEEVRRCPDCGKKLWGNEDVCPYCVKAEKALAEAAADPNATRRVVEVLKEKPSKSEEDSGPGIILPAFYIFIAAMSACATEGLFAGTKDQNLGFYTKFFPLLLEGEYNATLEPGTDAALEHLRCYFLPKHLLWAIPICLGVTTIRAVWHWNRRRVQRLAREPEKRKKNVAVALLVFVPLSIAVAIGVVMLVRQTAGDANKLREAHKLYEGGSKAEAVALYKEILFSGTGEASRNKVALQRLVDFEVEQGNSLEASHWIVKGLDRRINVVYETEDAKALQQKIQGERATPRKEKTEEKLPKP